MSKPSAEAVVAEVTKVLGELPGAGVPRSIKDAVVTIVTQVCALYVSFGIITNQTAGIVIAGSIAALNVAYLIARALHSQAHAQVYSTHIAARAQLALPAVAQQAKAQAEGIVAPAPVAPAPQLSDQELAVVKSLVAGIVASPAAAPPTA